MKTWQLTRKINKKNWNENNFVVVMDKTTTILRISKFQRDNISTLKDLFKYWMPFEGAKLPL